MTGILDAILAAIVAVFMNLAVVLQIRSRAPQGEVRFLTRVYTGTLLLRYCLAVILNVFAANSAFAATFWGDSGTYDAAGHQLALLWSGDLVATVASSSSVSGYGWIYFVGLLYYLVGRNQLLVQFVNGLIGATTVLVVYAMAHRLFGAPAARWAALFMAFFPQMVFWSAGMYKDPPILLCLALCMYAVLRLREGLSIEMIALFVGSELALITLRFYVAYFVAFAALATFLFGRRRGTMRLLFTFSLLLAMLMGALTLAIKRETLERQASYVSLERLQATREDQARWGGSGFGQEYDVSTPGGALAALPVGLVYLLFAPFPWAISGVRQALAMPETLVWYALMPAFVRGLKHAVRHRFRAVLPILVFAATLTAAYAIMQGNVGTAYRQRTQISMFFFVFIGVGLVEKRAQRKAVTPAGASGVRTVPPRDILP